MSKNPYFSIFQENPIVVAVRNPKDIKQAVLSDSNIIFLLCGNIYNLKQMVKYCLDAHKYVFVHLDLLKGYSPDYYFIKYLKDEIRPTGVISTKNNLILKAKQEHLLTIQRLFLLDSAAENTVINSVKKIKPDAVEILPGLVPKIITRVYEEIGTDTPIICGGFIEKEEEVLSSIKAGAISSSTSYKLLWNANLQIKNKIKTLN